MNVSSECVHYGWNLTGEQLHIVLLPPRFSANALSRSNSESETPLTEENAQAASTKAAERRLHVHLTSRFN